MSIIGTGVAAAAAGATHAAQQVARKKDKRETEPAEQARRVREAFETHLQAVEEGDEPDAPTNLRVNPHTPNGQSAEHDETIPDADDRSANPTPNAESQSDEASNRASSTHPLQQLERDSALYNHLDIKA